MNKKSSERVIHQWIGNSRKKIGTSLFPMYILDNSNKNNIKHCFHCQWIKMNTDFSWRVPDKSPVLKGGKTVKSKSQPFSHQTSLTIPMKQASYKHRRNFLSLEEPRVSDVTFKSIPLSPIETGCDFLWVTGYTQAHTHTHAPTHSCFDFKTPSLYTWLFK